MINEMFSFFVQDQTRKRNKELNDRMLESEHVFNYLTDDGVTKLDLNINACFYRAFTGPSANALTALIGIFTFSRICHVLISFTNKNNNKSVFAEMSALDDSFIIRPYYLFSNHHVNLLTMKDTSKEINFVKVFNLNKLLDLKGTSKTLLDKSLKIIKSLSKDSKGDYVTYDYIAAIDLGSIRMLMLRDDNKEICSSFGAQFINKLIDDSKSGIAKKIKDNIIATGTNNFTPVNLMNFLQNV